MKRSITSLTFLALATILAVAFSGVAIAGPANQSMVRDFYTAALDADGCFKLVHCAHAHMTMVNGIVRENYRCTFVDDPDGLGSPSLPRKAVKWDYDNSQGVDWEACTLKIEPPYRWFSDVYDILTGDDLCWMYTNPFGQDIGDSSFSMRVTPSGNVNVTVVYDPPVLEGPECP